MKPLAFAAGLLRYRNVLVSTSVRRVKNFWYAASARTRIGSATDRFGLGALRTPRFNATTLPTSTVAQILAY